MPFSCCSHSWALRREWVLPPALLHPGPPEGTQGHAGTSRVPQRASQSPARALRGASAGHCQAVTHSGPGTLMGCDGTRRAQPLPSPTWRWLRRGHPFALSPEAVLASPRVPPPPASVWMRLEAEDALGQPGDVAQGCPPGSVTRLAPGDVWGRELRRGSSRVPGTE